METLQKPVKKRGEARKLSFSSASENLALVEKLIDEVCHSFEINENHYGNILIAVTEAVNNAIYHGNRLNPDKKVRVTFEPKAGRFAFTVEDEGKGFDPNCLPDPTAPENLDKPYGRGIFLMKNLSDHVKFSNNGRTVEIAFEVGRN